MSYRKILTYTLPLVVAFFTLIPPIDFRIPAPPGEYWPLMKTITGLAGIRILFIRTSFIVKFVALTAFIGCFFSSLPFVSAHALPGTIFCCYLYILLTRMDSWRPMFAMLKSILLLNLIFLCVQLMGEDRILNFGLDRIACFGVIGHHMQAGSFSVVLAAFLSIIHPAFWLFPIFVGIICNSAWTLLCACLALLLVSRSKLSRWAALGCAIGFIIICLNSNKIGQGLAKDAGRLTVWKTSISMLNERPWMGWGPATYKVAFPALSEMKSIPWKTAHNDPIQLAFEIGYPQASLYFLLWLYVLYYLRGFRHTERGKYLWIAYLIISMDSLVHFPGRMIQCVPLMVAFLAYCETQTLKEYRPFTHD